MSGNKKSSNNFELLNKLKGNLLFDDVPLKNLERDRNKNDNEKLKEIINRYKEVLKTLKKHPKIIGIVKSKHFVVENYRMYRVEINDREFIMPCIERDITTDEALFPEIDQEVMIVEDSIVSIVPKPLQKNTIEHKISLVKWEDIGGLKEQIEEIRDAIEIPLKYPELVKSFKMPLMSGTLLWGPPGCGKTLIAKAIAFTIIGSERVDKDAFITIKGGEVLNKYVGESEKMIANIFNRSRNYTEKTGKRGIIFVDEAEALVGIRSQNKHSVVPSFLAEMDGMDDKKPFVILATNLPGTLDPAIIREGRIDIKLFIDRPDTEAFEEITKIHLNKTLCADNISNLAIQTRDYVFNNKIKNIVSGAMAETIVKYSSARAIKRYLKDNTDKKGIILRDIEDAILKIKKSYGSEENKEK